MATDIGFLTFGAQRELTTDDQHLARSLEAYGVTVRPAVWSDDSVRWDDFDGVIIRSCWDYHLRHEDFLCWLGQVERARVPVINPPNTVRWNIDKRYLRELELRGTRLVPTRWVERGASVSLAALLGESGWSEAVVKPAISASAHATWRTSHATAQRDESKFVHQISRGNVLVQPFLPEIVENGEWSLVYLDGRFSHAVLKRTVNGDFRVQHNFGGTSELASPPDYVRETADRIVADLSSEWVFARVDGCVRDAQFLLMELELIEPVLFFALAPYGAQRLADALVRRLGVN